MMNEIDSAAIVMLIENNRVNLLNTPVGKMMRRKP